MPKRIDVTGKKFNRLTALYAVKENNKWIWVWKCDCGNTVKHIAYPVRIGSIKSCGCYNSERLIKHGHSKRNTVSRTRSSYKAMMSRCYNKNNSEYFRYGGANPPITVCKEWKGNFTQFLIDMGERPEGTSLGRKHYCLEYSKQNCSWETPSEQNKDRKCTRWVTLWGNKYTLSEACTTLSIKYYLVNTYIVRKKCTAEEGLIHILKKHYGGKDVSSIC